MPGDSPGGSTCLNVWMNYRHRRGSTPSSFGNSKVTCPVPSGTFETCVNFEPAYFGDRAAYTERRTLDGVSDDVNVTYDEFYWALEWKSGTHDYESAKLRPPTVEVLDVRPGTCS